MLTSAGCHEGQSKILERRIATAYANDDLSRTSMKPVAILLTTF